MLMFSWEFPCRQLSRPNWGSLPIIIESWDFVWKIDFTFFSFAYIQFLISRRAGSPTHTELTFVHQG